MTNTRRQFLRTTLASSAALTLGSSVAGAIEPIQRSGKAPMKLSLAAYSFNRQLRLNIKPKPPMTLDDFIDYAAEVGLGAVELTQYYFPRTTPEYLAHLKGKCTRLGLDVSGTAVGNDFCVADPARLKQQIAQVKAWVEHTSRLGGKTIRIFAGRVPRGDTEEQARKRCVEAIQEACDHAGQFGIYLALENHGGITGTADQILWLVKAVKHDWFGVNLDTGNFHTEDPYADLARVAPYAVVTQVKVEIHRAGAKSAEEADLKRIIDILRDVNYRGYVALEYEAREDPHKAIPRYLNELRKLIG
jgi:sugar phosphate isomerase/epimerase